MQTPIYWAPKSPDDWPEAKRIINSISQFPITPETYDEYIESIERSVEDFEEDKRRYIETLEASGQDTTVVESVEPEVVWMSSTMLLNKIQEMRLPLTSSAIITVLGKIVDERKKGKTQ